MKICPKIRSSETMESTISPKDAIFFGLKELLKPNMKYRLGLLWIILDPFIIATVYAFLIVVVRGNFHGYSIVIGVITLRSMSRPIARNTALNLANEPFPMMHTPTTPLLISRFSTDCFQAAFIGLAVSLAIIPLSGAPLTLALHLPIICVGLAIFGTSVGLIISPFATLVNDLQKIVSYALLSSLFLLAVLYDYDATSGLHKIALSYIPHTFGVEWIRHVMTDNLFPFGIDHIFFVCSIWSIVCAIGIYRCHELRWRLTTWT